MNEELLRALVDLVFMLESGESGKLGVNVLRFNGGSVTEGQYRSAMKAARVAIFKAKESQDA